MVGRVAERDERVLRGDPCHLTAVARVRQTREHSLGHATAGTRLVNDQHSSGRRRLPQDVLDRERRHPAKIQDHATFAKPQQLSTGVRDVFVNGVQVLKDGEHTGAKPGRFVRGPGWTGWASGGACK